MSQQSSISKGAVYGNNITLSVSDALNIEKETFLFV